MKRLGRTIRDHVGRVRGVERFVRLVVAGGVALVAGLWVATLARVWSSAWVVGAVLVLLGVGGLAAGIRSELDY